MAEKIKTELARALCMAALDGIVLSESRQQDRLQRARLLRVVAEATQAGIHLGLSEPDSELGAKMRRVNHVSRKRGWL